MAWKPGTGLELETIDTLFFFFFFNFPLFPIRSHFCLRWDDHDLYTILISVYD